MRNNTLYLEYVHNTKEEFKLKTCSNKFRNFQDYNVISDINLVKGLLIKNNNRSLVSAIEKYNPYNMDFDKFIDNLDWGKVYSLFLPKNIVYYCRFSSEEDATRDLNCLKRKLNKKKIIKMLNRHSLDDRATAIYIRQRGESDNSEKINEQLSLCKDYLSRISDAEPIVYVDDEKIGQSENKIALQKLLGDVRKGLIKSIVVKHPDRITRSIVDYLSFRQALKENNVEFISVN